MYTQENAVLPERVPGCTRTDIEAYLSASGLAGWAVGTSDTAVVEVYVPDERADLATQLADALVAACGPAVSVTTGPGFKPVGG